MTFTFTVPNWAFLILYAYLLVGLLAYVPLNHWAARFISPRRRGRDVWRQAKPKRIVVGVLACAFWWPYMLGWVIRDEWKYGLGKRRVRR